MMETAENADGDDLTVTLDRAPIPRIFAERNVRASRVVVVGKFGKGPAQMIFALDHDMIQTFAPDGPDDALDVPVLVPRSSLG